MNKSKKQSKADKAFINKIKSIGFSCGGKTVAPKSLAGPGAKVILMKGYVMTLTQHPRTPEERKENEHPGCTAKPSGDHPPAQSYARITCRQSNRFTDEPQPHPTLHTKGTMSCENRN